MFLSFCGKTPRDEGAAFVAPSATVQGDVILKPGSTVWYGAVLRGDDGTLTIGKNSNVQDNAVLHCDIGGCVTLGENVTVGHCALVHGCTVGDGSLIGMHATLLNHCVVGKNCIIRKKYKMKLRPHRGAFFHKRIRYGHPGQLGGGGRARPGHQAGEPRAGGSQPAQRRALCRARKTARRADEKRVRASSNVSFCIFFALRYKVSRTFLIFHRNVMTFFVKSGILYLAGTVGPQPLPRT